MVNEGARQHYLRQLGIVSYYCRQPLPGAAPSPHFEWPQELPSSPAAPTGPAAPPTVTASALRAQVQQRATSAAAPLVQAREPMAPEPQVQPERQRHTPGNTPQPFSFVWMSPQAGLAILAEQPQGHRGRLPPPLRQLMLRILTALNPDFARLEPAQVANFHWPFDQLSAAADVSAARDAVAGFIAQRRRLYPAQQLLLMADDLPGYLYTDQQIADLAGQAVHHHPTLPLQVLCIPSLQAMQEQPALKRPAWAVMQQLMLTPGS